VGIALERGEKKKAQMRKGMTNSVMGN